MPNVQPVISGLDTELAEEPSLLSKFRSRALDAIPSSSILVGAGDSYCAALCASHLSQSESLVLDPYELIAAPKLARSKTVVFVSVSGRTKSNLAAARAVRRFAEERIGVTSVEGSPLAKEVDRVVLLPFDYQPRSPGLASFALSLACTSRLLSVDIGMNFERASLVGRKLSRRLALSRMGTTFFLGNRALYAVAMYAAAKLYEFFGAPAHYQRLEEFSHMELFSIRRGDAVNIYDGSDPLQIGRTLTSSLRIAGYDASFVSAGKASETVEVFAALFATQFAVLRWAKEKGIKKPRLLGAGKRLAISDSMIY